MALVFRPSRLRRLTFIALGVGIAALLAALALVGTQTTLAVAVGPFIPGRDSGHIEEGTVVTLADDDVPAVARLDPGLLEAMRQAETDASADGIRFQVTSGWRSERYQQWLLEDAIDRYGSEEVAREYVATPDASRHVGGHAVDIVPLEAQLWLSQYGAAYGICQTYANERWHFELATEPGGVCPEMRANAAG
jgi:D-alanyl-D-alanine carboxypeptidase